MKACRKCAVEKPLDEFYRDPRSKDGQAAQCKMCDAEKARRWREVNKDRHLDNARRWRVDHTEQIAETRRRWEETHREQRAASNQRWRDENKEHRAADFRRWSEDHKEQRVEYRGRHYAANRERELEINASWKYAHPDKVFGHNAVRRARKAVATIGPPVDRQCIVTRDESTCQYCDRVLTGREITLDHIIPLIRGGPHTADNLCVACRPCNFSKGTKTADEFLALIRMAV